MVCVYAPHLVWLRPSHIVVCLDDKEVPFTLQIKEDGFDISYYAPLNVICDDDGGVFAMDCEKLLEVYTCDVLFIQEDVRVRIYRETRNDNWYKLMAAKPLDFSTVPELPWVLIPYRLIDYPEIENGSVVTLTPCGRLRCEWRNHRACKAKRL